MGPVEVVHDIPGRLRLRVRDLRRDRRAADALVAAAANHPGVRSVRVNRSSASVVIRYDPAIIGGSRPQALAKRWSAAESAAAPGEAAQSREADKTVDGSPGRVGPIALAASGVLLGALGGPFRPIAAAATLASALPIVGRAAAAAVRQRRPAVDQLDAAAIAAMIALGDIRGASVMSGLVAVGEEVRERTARRSSRAVLDLHSALGRSAWLVRGTERVRVPVTQLKVRDRIVVYPGDLIPVDGVVYRGSADVDQKMLTGESRPVPKASGDSVLAGTAVADGKLYIRATAVGASTHAGWIMRALEGAPLHDTRAANHAARVADRLVVPTFLLAGASLIATRNVRQAASILIMDFATGVRVSAPTAVMATVSRAASDGILIRGGRAVENLAAVDAVIFDKTGTLTTGLAVVTRVDTLNGHSESDVVALAAAAEDRLRHPAARAIVDHARSMGLVIPAREHSEYEIGMGVRAIVGGREIRVGREDYLASAGIDLPSRSSGGRRRSRQDVISESRVWVAVGSVPIGSLVLEDPAREESGGVVGWLLEHGIEEVLMVSGDDERTANAVAARLGIDRVHAGTMPDEKADIVRKLQQQGRVVAVVGDGINDSPALALADVSISLHLAADIARENADVVLMDSNLWKLPHTIGLARDCMALIHQNLGIVAAPNAAGLALAAIGRLGPLTATILNNGSSVIAAGNSLRPLVRTGGVGQSLRWRN